MAKGAGLGEKEGHHQYTAMLCSLLGTGLFYLDAGISRTRRGDTFPHAKPTVHVGERRRAEARVGSSSCHVYWEPAPVRIRIHSWREWEGNGTVRFPVAGGSSMLTEHSSHPVCGLWAGPLSHSTLGSWPGAQGTVVIRLEMRLKCTQSSENLI